MAKPGPNGIIPQPNKLNNKLDTGARIKINLLDCAGITFSLRISLRASANG